MLMDNKKILLIDMDGVLVNLDKSIGDWFDGHPHLIQRYIKNPDHIPGIFRDPEPIDGAIQAIRQLEESGKYDMYIATTAPWGNPDASSDKRYWVEKYFGELFHKKMFVTHRKDMIAGDILIDDRKKNGAENFKGKFMHFGWCYESETWNEYPTWDSVLNELL